jgi:hypothetical protein
MHAKLFAALQAVASAFCAANAAAQCTPHWSAYPGPQLDDNITGLTVWDPDGAGPAGAWVIAGGNFQHVGAAPLNFVGAWDGSAWRSLGSGVIGTVECIGLYTPPGGSPQPVIGGLFGRTADGQTVLNGVARFDGTQWQPFGVGVGPTGTDPTVYCLTQWGSSLVIGGTFGTAGGLASHDVARWDGSAWSPFTNDLFIFDSLATMTGALYGGGLYYSATVPQFGVSRWNGQSWEIVGQNYPDDEVYALAVFRGQLIAGGRFHNGGNAYIARFDGAAWQPLGSGLNFNVNALTVFDPDGPGPMPDLLIAGGSFSTAGGQPALFIAAWDGSTWSPLGSGTSAPVRALTVWNNQLVVGGDFYSAGGLVSPGMAFWGCPQPATCYPNCDASTTPPVLNINDFTCFLNAFAAGSPYANCDNSTLAPTLNILDFVCFLNTFAAGCG